MWDMRTEKMFFWHHCKTFTTGSSENSLSVCFCAFLFIQIVEILPASFLPSSEEDRSQTSAALAFPLHFSVLQDMLRLAWLVFLRRKRKKKNKKNLHLWMKWLGFLPSKFNRPLRGCGWMWWFKRDLRANRKKGRWFGRKWRKSYANNYEWLNKSWKFVFCCLQNKCCEAEPVVQFFIKR